MYAEKIDGIWQDVSPFAFRAARPNMLIPDPALESAGLYAVTVDPQPETAWNEAAEGALAESDGRPVWQWTVRPMTGAEVAGVRSGAEMTRSDFIIAAVMSGIIAAADGEAAARGEVPPGLAPLIDAMSPEERFMARIRWGAATRINRMDPLILTLAASLGVTDNQLDALFGLG